MALHGDTKKAYHYKDNHVTCCSVLGARLLILYPYLGFGLEDVPDFLQQTHQTCNLRVCLFPPSHWLLEL